MNAAIAIPVAALAAFGAWHILGLIRKWAADRYEVTHSRRGLRAARRWYSPAAQVTLADASGDDPDRYAVLGWSRDEGQASAWLLVHKLDPAYLTYWDDTAESFWAPLARFAPYAVRRIRPHWWRLGPIPLPSLTKYQLVPSPAAAGGGTS